MRLTIAIVLAVLTLTGCTPVVATSSPDGPAIAGESFAETPTEQPTQPPNTAAFGNAVTYEDGLAISVSIPTPFVPSEYAVGVTFPSSVLFNITVTNGTNTNFDPFLYATASAGGQEAAQIYDTAVGLAPTTVLLPTQTVTYQIAFSVAETQGIVVQIVPGLDYRDAIFTDGP